MSDGTQRKEGEISENAATLETRLRKMGDRIRHADIFISRFPSPPIEQFKIVDLLVEAATVVGIQRGMLAKQDNANNGGPAWMAELRRINDEKARAGLAVLASEHFWSATLALQEGEPSEKAMRCAIDAIIASLQKQPREGERSE